MKKIENQNESKPSSKNRNTIDEYFIRHESNIPNREKVFLIVRSFKKKDKTQRGIVIK